MKKTISNKKNDEHSKAIGSFSIAALDYIDKFKIGGKQKLQKIIGEDLFFKSGKGWYFNNAKVIRMSTTQLKNLAKKIQQAPTP